MELKPDDVEHQMDEEKAKQAAAQKIIEGSYDNPVKLTAETLTIGCEFEFVLSWYRPGAADESEDWGLQHVLKVLLQTHVILCSGCGQEFEHKLDTKVRKGGDDYSHWQVDFDRSISVDPQALIDLANPEQYQFFPFEVKSRIFRFNESADMEGSVQHQHWIAYDREIESVLDRLNRSFDGNAEGLEEFSVLATRQCSMHVHIGNGKDRPIPFNVVKKVFCTCLICERQIDKMHSVDRITGTMSVSEPLSECSPARTEEENLIEKAYNYPLSFYFLRAAHIARWKLFKNASVPIQDARNLQFEQAKYSYDVGSWLELVRGVEDVTDLRQMVSYCDKSCTINVRECLSRYRPATDIVGKKLTIEFRQHMGTLSPDAALSWIDVVANLILRCSSITDERLPSVFRHDETLRDPHFSTLDFCKWVGCNATTVEFYEQLFKGTGDFAESESRTELSNEVWRKSKIEQPAQAPSRAQLELTRKVMSQDAIQQRIEKKLISGCYGQFSNDNLKILVSNNIDRDRARYIQLGYRFRISPELLAVRCDPESPTASRFGAPQEIGESRRNSVNDPVAQDSESSVAESSGQDKGKKKEAWWR